MEGPHTMTKRIISIAKQFSPTPAGRDMADGPFPGARFRDEFLLPALSRDDDEVIVDMDGGSGFGSSFLEEAFGGLVRKGFDPALLHRRLVIRSSHPSYAARVWGYIDEARGSG